MKTALRLGISAVLLVMAGAGWFWSQKSSDSDNDTGNPLLPAPNYQPAPAPVWKAATPAEQSAAQKSIVTQLEHFKNDRWAQAAQFQSRNLRTNFGGVAEFREVIEKNYPQFASYKSIKFERGSSSGSQIQIGVRITGTDGVKQEATYLLVKEDGIYRVAGVSGGLSQAPQLPDEPGDRV